MKNKIIITTAIDYANDVIHIGHAYQKILVDVFARFYRLSGKEVFYVTGTDEHGANIELQAKNNGKTSQEFVDDISKKDQAQIDDLNISYDRFIRTTDQDHKEIVGKFWSKIYDKGDIYLKEIEGNYCLSCESFKTDSEIIDGCCDVHKTLKVTIHKEQNYFFKWSNYQDFLEEFFKANPDFVLPKSKFKEMENFLKSGLEDISISRQSIDWGIPVPNDPSQVIYVWFDALINYYTAGIVSGFWDEDTSIIHFLGKDNLRWHSLLWPAMLKAADLKLPDTIYSHSFINIDGNKVSKTIGNVIRPSDLVSEFGTDAVRYFFLKRGPLVDDVDISVEKIKEVFNADLANGLGNLVQRITKIAQNVNFKINKSDNIEFSPAVITGFDNFNPGQIIEDILNRVAIENRYIETEKLWEKQGDDLIVGLERCITSIIQIAYDLRPFMPEASAEIIRRFNGDIIHGDPLFQRIK